MNRSRISILVIDRQTYWREYAGEALQDAGYQIATLGTYGEVLDRIKDGASWNIILLGCASVEYQERMLITYLIAKSQPVIILSTALTVQGMRDLFLQGVEDVTDKTYHSAEIIAIIEQAQEQIIKRDRPWKLAEKGAFYEKTRTHPGR